MDLITWEYNEYNINERPQFYGMTRGDFDRNGNEKRNDPFPPEFSRMSVASFFAFLRPALKISSLYELFTRLDAEREIARRILYRR